MRKFLTISLIWVSPIIILIAVVSTYLDCCVMPNQHGDLERLSEFVIEGDKNEYERLTSIDCDNMNDLCVDLYAGDTILTSGNVRILTIGDSFSNNIQVNKRYSNFIANAINSNIYNLKFSVSNPLQVAATALNNGQIDELSPDFVIIETAERYLWTRISDLKLADYDIDILSNNHEMSIDHNKNTILDLVKSKINRALNFSKLPYSTNPTIKLRINQPRFSIESQNLYVYYQDVKNENCMLSNDQLKVSEEKLISLQRMYSAKGVKLIFLIASDKYGMYQDDIINNSYPPKVVATQLSAVLHNDFYVNSKDILRPYIENGALDIYYSTDTHWSPIAAKIIGDYIADMINSSI
ncbi:MAG: hypothetical protein SNH41_02295 [Rikenellaceae bacterium]